MEITDHTTGVTTTAPDRKDRSATHSTALLSGRDRQKAQTYVQGLTTAIGEDLASTQDSPTTAGYTASVDPIQQLVRRMPGRGLTHDVQLLTFHLMRRYSPTLNNVIRISRALEGDLVIRSEDEGLERELTDWMRQVNVGYLAGNAAHTGLDTYLNMMASAADEYGMTAGEIRLMDNGRGIERLVVPNARTLSTSDRDGDGLEELYQSQTVRRTGGTQGRRQRRLDDKETVQTLSFRPTANGTWPQPLAWAAVQSTEAMMRMYESVLNGWWRFGDPSLLTKMEFDAEASPDMVTIPGAAPDGGDMEVPASLLMLKDSLQKVMEARRNGEVGDAFGFSDGGSVESETLGEVDSTLMDYFQEHASVFDSHVVAAVPLPAFLVPSVETSGDGLGSSRSQSMASIAATATKRRNNRKRPLARQVLNTELTLRGDSQFVGEFRVEYEAIDILDDKLRAEAAAKEAEAEATTIQNVVQKYTEDGERRFSGEAERHLEEEGVYPSDNPNAE